MSDSFHKQITFWILKAEKVASQCFITNSNCDAAVGVYCLVGFLQQLPCPPVISSGGQWPSCERGHGCSALAAGYWDTSLWSPRGLSSWWLSAPLLRGPLCWWQPDSPWSWESGRGAVVLSYVPAYCLQRKRRLHSTHSLWSWRKPGLFANPLYDMRVWGCANPNPSHLLRAHVQQSRAWRTDVCLWAALHLGEGPVTALTQELWKYYLRPGIKYDTQHTKIIFSVDFVSWNYA